MTVRMPVPYSRGDEDAWMTSVPGVAGSDLCFWSISLVSCLTAGFLESEPGKGVLVHVVCGRVLPGESITE